MRGWPRAFGVLGAGAFAAVGAVWGSTNAGWFGLERDATHLQAWLGVATAVVVAAFAFGGLGPALIQGGAGTAAAVFLVAAPLLHVASAVIEFAIFGTLALAVGLILLTADAFRRLLVPLPDRLVIAGSAVASFTWNTETASVWLLVGIGICWAFLSLRLLPFSARSADSDG